MQVSTDHHEVSPERTRRLFFAFWPDDELRATFEHATHKAARSCGGRPVPAHNLHATALFLGSVVESRVAEVAALGARAAAETAASGAAGADEAAAPPVFVFDRIEIWNKAHVLVATQSASAGAGDHLANALVGILQRQMSGAGFAPDPRPFRAHVTVARKVGRSAHSLSMRPVVWDLRELALVESRTETAGPVYTVLRTFPFR